MKTPREKYQNDPEYNALVKQFEYLIDQAVFTPSEIREAALLASINHEMRNNRSILIPKHINEALITLDKYTTEETK